MRLRELHQESRRNSKHRCHECRKYARWTFIYIAPDEHSKVLEACGSHTSRTLQWISSHRHPDLDRVQVVDNGVEG